MFAGIIDKSEQSKCCDDLVSTTVHFPENILLNWKRYNTGGNYVAHLMGFIQRQSFPNAEKDWNRT